MTSAEARTLPSDGGRQISISIVVCTDGRLACLKALIAALRCLAYEDFEVCIVQGPTDDGTAAFLAATCADAKLGRCDTRNLSRARNIGIAMADGEIVAFLDDDALPEPEWLRDLAAAYVDLDVGGAGGFVYDNTGVAFQARYVTTDRLGYPHGTWPEATPHLDFPLSPEYPHLLGTNCSFRRAVLLGIGGFDEEYEYFLDETDVCCRVVDAGYRIAQLPCAFVHHKFAPSAMRDLKRIVTRWYPLIKNRAYFAMRNGRYHHTIPEIVGAVTNDIEIWDAAVRAGVANGVYTEDDHARFTREAENGMLDGLERGRHPDRKLLERALAPPPPFRRFPNRMPPGGRRVVCIVTQDYPPGQNGGIARQMSELASSLAMAGHHVHVLTRAPGAPAVDVEDGVWVHRLAIEHHPRPAPTPIAPYEVPQHIWDYSRTMRLAVESIDARRGVDVVYGPLWDAEPVAFVLDRRFPVLCALQTTVRFWLESRPDMEADAAWMAETGLPIIATEELILERATLLQANSRAIVADIARKYGIAIPEARFRLVPHGMEDWARTTAPPADETARGPRLLFVGRLESRKGIDLLLAVAPSILRDFPDVTLDIVGDDTIQNALGDTYKAEFLRQDLDATLAPRLVFHGRVGEEALRGFYRDCDVLVAPSRYESFGLIYLEAMVFGKPVIAGDAGGGPEVIEDEVSGLLVAPGDAASLDAAIRRLLANASERLAMGRAARAAYDARFTIATVRDRMLAAFADCVEAFRASD